MGARFRDLLSGSTFLALGATLATLPGARAAPPVSSPSPSSAVNWAGVYGGLEGGLGFGRDKVSNWAVNPANSVTGAEGHFAPLPGQTSSFDFNGAMAGGRLGFAMQSGAIVWGAEAAIDGSGLDGSYGISNFDHLSTSTALSQQIDWLGTLRGRAGIAIDRFLVFGAGGFAWSGVKYRLDDYDGSGSSAGVDKMLHGWTLGGGVEYSLTRNVSLRAEYLYVNFCKSPFDFRNASGFIASGAGRSQVDIFKIGVDYHFN
jgi:outer membrane immunogenic protein